MYLIYNLVACVAAVLLFPWLAYRALRGRLPGLGQRLGFLPSNRLPPGQTVVWIHAVSLGEVKAAAPLIEALKSRNPGLRFVLTSSTRTGWNAARQLLGPEAVLFPPLDLKWICRRFLRHLRPAALVVLETELWPNLFAEAKRSGAVLLLVNGRISDRAFPRYRASRFLWRKVLGLPDALFAQSTQDAERLLAVGASPERVQVAGNLKFAVRPPALPIVESLQAALRTSPAGPVIVAGSTMPGEEKYLLEAFRQLLPEFPNLWMILAPRHPQRFGAVAAEIQDSGIAWQRRSEWQPCSPLFPGVFLLDSMGELGSVYQLASVAFVGGTLVPTGGHNILEPACFARPIVIGPSMNNFREIAEEFLEDAGVGQVPGGKHIRTGAIVQVADADGLAVALQYLVRNPEYARRLGEAAHTLLNRRLTGLAKIVNEVERLVGPKVPATDREAKIVDQAVVGVGRLP